MGVGYLFGCLISIVLWRVDRHFIFENFNRFLISKLNRKAICNLVYLIVIPLIGMVITLINNKELENLIVAFIVIEISSSERKTLINKVGDKRHFYDALSIISRSLVCGFMAPIIYIMLVGNIGGIVYTLIYYVSFHSNIYKTLNNVLNIIPCIIALIILYIIYVPRNKTFKISFRGDFLSNIFHDPLLNVYIMAAYIEAVNFYYYIERKNVHYLKSYGTYTNKIDDIVVKDYLSLIYSICFVIFIAFWIYQAEIISFIIKQ